jgi:hypothetical protein
MDARLKDRERRASCEGEDVQRVCQHAIDRLTTEDKVLADLRGHEASSLAGECSI